MSHIELPTFRATFGPDDSLRADDPGNAEKIGSPATVRVPNARGGISEQTGIVVEIRDGFIVIEFLVLDEVDEDLGGTMSNPSNPNPQPQPAPQPQPQPGKPEDPPAT